MSDSSRTVRTGGGAAVEGQVNTGGGAFIGRDPISYAFPVVQPPRVDEATLAADAARLAIEYMEQVLAIMREIGDQRGEALASWNLGLALEKEGELARAVRLMQACVDFEREISHPDAAADAQRVEKVRAGLKAEG